MPRRQSTIDQPKSNVDPQAAINCSIYAPAAAAQALNGTTAPTVAALIRTIGPRLGGSAKKAFDNLCGYGLDRAVAYKAKWGAVLARAEAQQHPVAIGVTWKNGTKTGNHWVYYVGTDAGKHYARDQQNGHLEITIGADWKGTATGGWTYTVTQISVGCPSVDDARPYTAL